MRLHGVWLALFVLAGCGSGSPSDGPDAVCRRQAYDDPAVKQLTVENLGPESANPDVQFEYNKALHDATNACLRQKGIQVRGGVEPVRP
jgi:hypothetical protein